MVTLAGDVGPAAKSRPPPADSSNRTPNNLSRTQAPRRNTPPGRSGAQYRQHHLPHDPGRANERQLDRCDHRVVGGVGRLGDWGRGHRRGGQIKAAARRQRQTHTQRHPPHQGTPPTHATGPGHTPKTGSIISPTPHGADINATVMVVIFVTFALLADVMTVAGDVGAATKSRPPPADNTKRTPTNLPRTQAPRRQTPPGRATRPTPAV